METVQKATQQASLFPYPVDDLSKPMQVGAKETTIGRAPSNDIRLSHGGVSRMHARISFENGHYVLTDFGSRNGTYVNGERVEKAVLRHEDKVAFGRRLFLFRIDGSALDSPAAESISQFEDTVEISEGELGLPQLLVHRADLAVNNFFEPPAMDEIEASDALAHKRLSLLYQLSERLRRETQVDAILEKGLDLIFKALPEAERGVGILLSEQTNAPDARKVKYSKSGSETGIIPISSTVLNRVIEERVAVVSQNLQDDPRFKESDSIVIHDLKSIICVPLLARNRVIGAVHIDTGDFLNPFTQRDMEFTAAVANELALSIENCELRTAAVNNEKMAAVGLAITNLAHNIRNLLNVNVNFVELLDLQLQDIQNGDIRKSWGYVRSGLEKIAGLTADIMEYTTVDTGEPETTDINSSVQMQCELVRQNLESEGIALEVKLTPNLPPCSICDVRLQRALLNLVINAKQALKETKNGCIKISTEKDDRGNVVTRVSDNGCGIPKEHLNRIFDLFFTTKGTDGSGLGLPMVKKFVESNGGRLSVVSQVGVGSVVTITLPPAAGAAATA